MKVLSIVCARKGSEGLENKCLRKIGNKVIIEFSIEYSLSLGNMVETVVSTDINEVIKYCKANDIDYIERDQKLCGNEVRITDVLIDAIEKRGKNYNYCSLVYGNIPTRYPVLFYDALKFLERHQDYDAVISMKNVEKYHPDWMFDYNEDILPKKKFLGYRRQVLPQKMIHDGHTHLFRTDGFCKRYKGIITYEKEGLYSIFGEKIKPLINDRVIIDVDRESDLKLAEAIILNSLNNRK